MCGPAAPAVIGIISAVASTGLGIYGAVSGYQGAKDQANYQYQVQRQQSQYQFSEQQRQMEYQYQEQLRQSEYNYQNQVSARQFEYNSASLQYDAQVAEQQRRFEVFRHVAAGEGGAVRRELVEVRRLDLLVAHEAVVVPCLIVRDDVNDVRRCRKSRRNRQQGQSEERKREAHGGMGWAQGNAATHPSPIGKSGV